MDIAQWNGLDNDANLIFNIQIIIENNNYADGYSKNIFIGASEFSSKYNSWIFTLNKNDLIIGTPILIKTEFIFIMIKIYLIILSMVR